MFRLLLLFFLILSNIHSQNILTEELKAKIDKAADEIVSQMSDSEKIGQVIHIAIPGKTVDANILKGLKKIKPGGIIFFGDNLGDSKQILELTTSLQSSMKKLKLLPLLISTDQEGGKVIRVKDGVTQFPGAMAVGQTSNPQYAYNVGFITSYELNQLGINFLLAPILDVNNNPNNPVIHVRSFGSDLKTVNSTAIEYEKGARVGGGLPVIKHFPGHGDTNIDSHKGLPIIHRNLEQIEAMELIPFKKALSEGAKAVMSAHILYPELDKKFPATLSRPILTELLRKKLNHKGLIITDAMEMDAISKNYHKKNTAVLALRAGADIILLTSWNEFPEKYIQLLQKGIDKKQLVVDGVNVLDEAVKRQVAAKIELGLLHKEYSFKTIEEPALKEYIDNKNKNAKEIYSKLSEKNIDKLNEEISIRAIRSYKKEFLPLEEKELKDIAFFVRSKTAYNYLKSKNLKVFSYKTILKKLKKEKFPTIVLESETEKHFKAISKIIQKNKDTQFILLHYGSPFFNFPKTDNLKVVFTFSPTITSKKAVFQRIFKSENAEPIQPANLIFAEDNFNKIQVQ